MPENGQHVIKTADGFNTLYSAEYDQTFHSRHGALQETEHVFLKGTTVYQRLQEGLECRVLEVGFGLGLNFLATAAQALQHNRVLYFMSLEKELILAENFEKLKYGQHPPFTSIAKSFMAWRASLAPEPPEGCYTFRYKNISLDIVLGDALVADLPGRSFHAVYHDAFSPDANPGLWTISFFEKVCGAMVEGAYLCTYSAKGSVRRNLHATGLRVEKLPGPPGKREMLRGRKER